MNGHILEQSARHPDVLDGRWRRVVAHDAEALEAPDRSLIEARLQCLEVRVEAAVETHEHHGLLQRSCRPTRTLEVQVERLLAENHFAGCRGSQRLIEMNIRGAGDDDP